MRRIRITKEGGHKMVRMTSMATLAVAAKTRRSMQEILKRSTLGLGAVALMGVVAAGLCPGTSLAAGPANVTDAALWLDASQLTGLTDGATVATWTDMSGNGNNAAWSKGTPTYRTNVLNGQPTLRFGTGDMFATADLSAQFPTAATLFIVATVGSDRYDILYTGANADEWWRYHGDGLSYPAVFRSPRVGGYCLMPTTGTHLFTVSSSSSAWQMWINGSSQGVAGGSYNAGGIQKIPGNDQPGRPFAGDIAEVLEYNRELSGAEKHAVGTYLATKYGLDTVYNRAGPAGVTDAALWLDASQLTGLANGATVATWTDMSGNGRHAAATGSAATYQTGALNGQPVVRFNADGYASFNFREDAEIRTVFWVVKNTNPGTHFLLGHSGAYDFHAGYTAPYYLWANEASSNIKNGTTKLMGTAVNGTATSLPSASYSLVSVVTTGPVKANQLSKDRGGVWPQSWAGDMAELVVYDRELSASEELAVGAYLANKYALKTAYNPGGPAGVTGAALWLDASQLTGLADGATVATWADMSGNSRHAAATGSAATYQTNALNGQPVVRFNADGNASFNFREDAAIRTVFWVVKNTNPGPHFLLGHSGAWDFHAGSTTMWDAGDANVNIRNGTTKLMGTAVNGITTSLPSTSYSLLSLVTTGNVKANQLSADRTGVNPRSWAGDMAEVLIYDRPLSSAEELAVGAYLANKYALATEYTSAGITWGSAQTMSADTDVTRVGTLAYAYGFNTAATVNTVPFAAGDNGSSLGTATNVVMVPAFARDGAPLGLGTPFTNLSAAYQAMTSYAIYTGPGSYRVALKNLTPGHTYLVQIWTDDSRTIGIGRNETVTSAGGNSVTLDYNSTDAEGGVGQYVTGTFTASCASQTFILTSASTPQLNALQVRDTTYSTMGTRISFY
jgi:hypothetical protein